MFCFLALTIHHYSRAAIMTLTTPRALRTLLSKWALCLLVVADGGSSRAADPLEHPEPPRFRNRDFTAWMAAAESDYEGFQDAVEFWGVELVLGWGQVLDRSKSSSERNAALHALGIALRDNGLESVRRAAATQAVPSLVSLLS